MQVANFYVNALSDIFGAFLQIQKFFSLLQIKKPQLRLSIEVV